MANYDFSTLSPYDFELLCRDLFSKSLRKRFESFAPGPDKGIDLRCFITDSNQIIVQCKHYSKFSDLKSKLKIEKTKISALKPTRYILATSVNLTLANKDEIISILSPYLTAPKDIYGRSDLNQLLTGHPDIERNHIKLWLSSSVVLEKILHSSVHNFSNFVNTSIIERIKLYVPNESLNSALDLLSEHKVVIISGEPGIGKTTLAHMLVYRILGMKEISVVALNSSIKEGFELYRESEPQIFLFDDFLGRNFLNRDIPQNEDEAIIRFTEKIKKSNNKLLIFTTREYILRQAYSRYEKLSDNQNRVMKFVLNIAHYSKKTKAKILYNHLYFSDLSKDILKHFVINRHYKKVIAHRNYNPRLISILTSNFKATTNIQDEFINFIMLKLDNPQDVCVLVHQKVE